MLFFLFVLQLNTRQMLVTCLHGGWGFRLLMMSLAYPSPPISIASAILISGPLNCCSLPSTTPSPSTLTIYPHYLVDHQPSTINRRPLISHWPSLSCWLSTITIANVISVTIIFFFIIAFLHFWSLLFVRLLFRCCYFTMVTTCSLLLLLLCAAVWHKLLLSKEYDSLCTGHTMSTSQILYLTWVDMICITIFVVLMCMTGYMEKICHNSNL